MRHLRKAVRRLVADGAPAASGNAVDDRQPDRSDHRHLPAQGNVQQLRQPLGYAMVGGLALSQVLTLYTTPVVYLYLDRLQTWLFGAKRGPIEEAEPPIHAVAAE